MDNYDYDNVCRVYDTVVSKSLESLMDLAEVKGGLSIALWDTSDASLYVLNVLMLLHNINGTPINVVARGRVMRQLKRRYPGIKKLYQNLKITENFVDVEALTHQANSLLKEQLDDSYDIGDIVYEYYS